MSFRTQPGPIPRANTQFSGYYNYTILDAPAELTGELFPVMRYRLLATITRL